MEKNTAQDVPPSLRDSVPWFSNYGGPFLVSPIQANFLSFTGPQFAVMYRPIFHCCAVYQVRLIVHSNYDENANDKGYAKAIIKHAGCGK